MEEKKRTRKYVPARFIWAGLTILIEFCLMIAAVGVITFYVPYFYAAVVLTQLVVAVAIINSHENPDYKVPWLFFDLLLPVVGFMAYFVFYKRNLSKSDFKALKEINKPLAVDDRQALENCKKEDKLDYSQVKCIKGIANTHLYQNTDIKFLASGEEMFASMLEDLKTAKEFIFVDYFIIEKGVFWDSVLKILQKKVQENVEVRVIYDDIGCMKRVSSLYYKKLQKMGINAIPFNILRGQANGDFNNRNHRKIMVIDGKIAYTGGINLADEYINQIHPFGHWKDVGVRIEGEAVSELTRLVLMDFVVSSRKRKDLDYEKYYKQHSVPNQGFCMPFGDGPNPVYTRRVAKTVILNIINQAQKYVYITTPYLIVDDEIVQSLENAGLRGIDVKIITPHIPDKKIVFQITQSYYDRLTQAGVKIFEYKPGFIHAKTYLSDDTTALVGTINLDHRSLVHHFEDGVWIYKHDVIKDIKNDFLVTQSKSVEYKHGTLKTNFLKRFAISFINIFSTLF